MLKATELGERVDASAHALKKSRYNALLAGLEDRRVHPRAAPNRGPSKRRADNARTPPSEPSQPHRLQRTTVTGRKKPPSQMHLKREGGPRKRSALHGG